MLKTILVHRSCSMWIHSLHDSCLIKESNKMPCSSFLLSATMDPTACSPVLPVTSCNNLAPIGCG